MRPPTLILTVLLLAACDSEPAAETNDAGGESATDAGEQDAEAQVDQPDAAEESAVIELTPPSGAQCDPSTPDCPAGEKCSTTRWDLQARWPAPSCILDLEGLGNGEMAPCLGAPGTHDGCGPGLACFNAGTGEGYCTRACASDPDVCPETTVCAPADPDSSFALCLPSCNVDADCVFEQWLVCTERDGVRFCDARHAASLD